MNTDTFPFGKAMALFSLFPTATFYGMVNGDPVTLTGSVFKGFLMPGDTLTHFKKWN